MTSLSMMKASFVLKLAIDDPEPTHADTKENDHEKEQSKDTKHWVLGFGLHDFIFDLIEQLYIQLRCLNGSFHLDDINVILAEPKFKDRKTDLIIKMASNPPQQ